jgi:pyruvate-ferredoxin/flavodoxin oxidoreductase
MKKIMMDGNLATAHVAYACSEVATIYPITPSSSMAEACDEWSSEGKKNVFGDELNVVQMQSEAGAAGAMHGSLSAGALTTTFTASQGLLLMIPNMYKMAGELLPAVFHVSARSVATHALSIFGDHSDVMATRQTGFNMIASSNPQEAMDLGLASHIASLKTSLPFLHFFDGFRTSHQINNVEPIPYETIKQLLPYEKIQEFKQNSLNPSNPHQQGTSQKPDIFFQNREASTPYYKKVADNVQESFDEIYNKTGRLYNLFDYYGCEDAQKVIVIMGSATGAVEETVDHLNKQGQKLGLVKVRLYRPFNIKAFVNSLPKTVTHISVLDKTKENGSIGEPLYLDVSSALNQAGKTDIKVVGGRYGLGGKDFTPAMVKAVFDNLNNKNKHRFTVGINDDVSNSSLEVDNDFIIDNKNVIECKFYGLGGDGTVSASKSAIKIIGETTSMYSQGFFEYDSKKSGSVTISHLRFGQDKIKGNYLVDNANIVACNNITFLNKYDMLSSLKKGGVFLLNTNYSSTKELEKHLPQEFKAQIANKGAKLYNINAQKLAYELGLNNKVNTIMQSAFFYLTNIINYEKAKQKMKQQNKKAYSKFGNVVIENNNKAVEAASEHLFEVKYDVSWKIKKPTLLNNTINNDYYQNFIKPVLALKGNDLKVSSFNASGKVPTNTAKYEKRQIATECPLWLEGKCIQCNKCAFVCPHGAIKPVLISEEEAKTLPDEFIMTDAKGVKGAKYRMQINPLDCTGCGSCVNVCPTNALKMEKADTVKEKELNNYNLSTQLKNVEHNFKETTVKGSQFKESYFDFSGACAGCGETPYLKLLTQLFGDRMIVANATGCSSIYGGSSPTCPYKKDDDGNGPAWANSLFEDNAEFGLGIKLAYKQRTKTLLNIANKLINSNLKNDNLKAYLKIWSQNYKHIDTCKNIYDKIVLEVENSLKQENGDTLIKHLKFIKSNLNLIIPKSFWLVGGDGWAYDIGFGGIDHVIASGENINMLVLDTEVYSNTGGQSSKASPTASVAKFAKSGKQTRKKDLGLMAMNYEDVYVASVAMGGNMNQLVKALTEAEQYNGPSIVIAYSTCINHGMDMSNPIKHMKNAVDSGYWSLYRYNPTLKQLGKNPFILDSKNADTSKFKDFLKTENRYNQLLNKDKKVAEELFDKAQKHAEGRIKTYKELAEK